MSTSTSRAAIRTLSSCSPALASAMAMTMPRPASRSARPMATTSRPARRRKAFLPSASAATPGDKEGNEIATLYLRGGKAFGDTFRVDGFARYLNKHIGAGRTGVQRSRSRARPMTTPAPRWTKSYLLAGSGTLSPDGRPWETIASASLTRDERRGDLTNFPFLLPGVVPTPADLAVPLVPMAQMRRAPSSRCNRPIEFGAGRFRQLHHRFCREQAGDVQERLPRLLLSGTAAEAVARTDRRWRAVPRRDRRTSSISSPPSRHDGNDDFRRRRYLQRGRILGDPEHRHAPARLDRHGRHQPHLHRTVRLRSRTPSSAIRTSFRKRRPAGMRASNRRCFDGRLRR